MAISFTSGEERCVLREAQVLDVIGQKSSRDSVTSFLFQVFFINHLLRSFRISNWQLFEIFDKSFVSKLVKLHFRVLFITCRFLAVAGLVLFFIVSRQGQLFVACYRVGCKVATVDFWVSLSVVVVCC